MCKNPYTWNDDVKAVYAAMREIEESDAFGPSVMVNIEQKVIAPLRERCSRAEQALADARTEIERLKAAHENILRKLVQRENENWKQVAASEIFQELKHGKYRDIFTLLSDGEISIGKAAEAIAERAGGIEPFLPAWNPPEHNADLSWRERHDKAVATLGNELATLRARCERLEAPVTGDELREQGFETVGADDRYLRMAFDEITRARAAAQTQKGEADANNDV